MRAADLPLEVTFAPTRINIHEAQAVIERAVTLGAFRFNTGKLMRIGTAARLWHKLAPTAEQYQEFRAVLDASARRVGDVMRLCYAPFSIEESLRDFTVERMAAGVLRVYEQVLGGVNHGETQEGTANRRK